MSSGRSILGGVFSATAIAVLLTGCVATPYEPNVSYAVRPSEEVVARPAGALAVDPPALAYAPMLNLDRQSRQPTAFVGYDATTTTTYVRQVDQQLYFPVYGRRGWGFGAYFDRSATVQQVTVRGR